MKIEAYLVISNTGVLRIVKGRPYLNNNEIALTLNINIPNSFFERLMPVAKITVPDEGVTKLDPTVAVDIAAQKVSEALRLEFIEVRDGLREMVLKENKDH